MSKYKTLLNILHQIREEAPSKYIRYRPSVSNIEGINQALSRAYIHLYFKVMFGITDFEERESLVTDDGNDGGVDAYFIDQELRKIYLIQSKFRTTERNFENKEITLNEILKMDADRIVRGETTDIHGTSYNGKVQGLIRRISEIKDIGRYDYKIIILANIKGYSNTDLKKITGGFEAEVFNDERTYNELVFPVVTGTYFNHPELKIYLNLTNKAAARIDYSVNTASRNCEITVLFVPTFEIAKTLHKYKNSILKFNPRNYLEMSGNPVNKDIANTITSLQTNEFSLYNNGITMLSYNTDYNEKIGRKDEAQIIITQPQIINGGQTAYTLSRLYQDCLAGMRDIKIFENKEVLLKVITFSTNEAVNSTDDNTLIEAISKATNQQNAVDEADRRANDPIQIEIQRLIFDKYGYFYERKRGEFADGIKEKYIDRSRVIKRELFMRLCKSCDYNSSEARNSTKKKLFSKRNFKETLRTSERVDEYIFAFHCYKNLEKIEKSFSSDPNNQYGVANYGNALRYGKFAVVSVCKSLYSGDGSENNIKKIIQSTLDKWSEFESAITQKNTNRTYFKTYYDVNTGQERQSLDFDGYYKGSTINKDLADFFGYELPEKRAYIAENPS